jgi:hypothetical protein
MLTHEDAAISTQPMAYDSNIHAQGCERLKYQVVDLYRCCSKLAQLKVLLLSVMSKRNLTRKNTKLSNLRTQQSHFTNH